MATFVMSTVFTPILKPPTGKPLWVRLEVFHACRDTLFLSATPPKFVSPSSRHQVVSLQSAGMQMSSSTIRQQLQSHNFSWATLIINNSGSRIRSVQSIPSVQGIHPFLTLSSCLTIPSCFHLRVLVISC